MKINTGWYIRGAQGQLRKYSWGRRLYNRRKRGTQILTKPRGKHSDLGEGGGEEKNPFGGKLWLKYYIKYT